MVQMTSYLHHNFMSIRESFSESLVKIRHDDVAWRHVTFSCILCLESADVSKKNCIIDGRVLIFRVQRYNTFPTRGQPPFYDKRLKKYRIFNIGRIFADFWWRLRQKSWRQQNTAVSMLQIAEK